MLYLQLSPGLAQSYLYSGQESSANQEPRAFMAGLIRVIANSGYQNILAIQEYFESINDLQVEWTVFRVGMLSGTSDAAAWSHDRRQGEAYAGPVGAPGYSAGVNRSVLAKWLVDESLTQNTKWAHQMPAISNFKE